MANDVSDLMDRLEATMRRLTWAMMDLDEDELGEVPDEGEWSPIQILAHVKACDDVMTGRIATVLTHPQPAPLANFDERRWAEIAGYADAPVDQTLMAMQRHRSEMVWQLRRLPEEAWDRTATHETRGTLTLYDLVHTFLEHEEEHVTQLEDLFEDLDEPDEEE
jgi:hypothetical protein